MKSTVFQKSLVIGALAAGLCGCDREPSTQTKVEEAVKAFEQAPAASAAPASAATPAAPAPAAPKEAAQQMNQAAVAYKAGNYVDTVKFLQMLRSQQGKTAEQLLALQDATAAMVGEIYAAAAKGDTRAQQAVKEYERLQNVRH